MLTPTTPTSASAFQSCNIIASIYPIRARPVRRLIDHPVVFHTKPPLARFQLRHFDRDLKPSLT